MKKKIDGRNFFFVFNVFIGKKTVEINNIWHIDNITANEEK